jgi:hypothetical protein
MAPHMRKTSLNPGRVQSNSFWSWREKNYFWVEKWTITKGEESKWLFPRSLYKEKVYFASHNYLESQVFLP